METENGVKTFLCPTCNTTFSRLHNFKKHERKIHGIIDDVKVGPAPEIFKFYSDHDFAEWKAKVEEETRSSFVKKSGLKKLTNQETVQYFHCHRSGVFTPRADHNRKRQLKRSGSIKIGCNCPAKMVVHRSHIDCAAELSVKFWPAHANHEIEPARLTLSRHEKSYLAEQLAVGVPKSHLLKNLEQSFDPGTRLALTTRKDLHNISSSFKIDASLCIHHDDSMSVDAHVMKLQSGGTTEADSSVLIYKRCGELIPEMPEFEQRDFILGIMTEAQLQLLAIHGNGIIQLDSTSGTNDYAYLLTTVLVTDLNGEAIPVAVLFSSCVDGPVFERFFSAVLGRLASRNETITVNVLITDDTMPFVDAWRKVFGPPNVELVCEWHIKRAFKRHLAAKVADFKLRQSVAKELDTLNSELDERAFDELLNTLCCKWAADEKTHTFANHFVLQYASRPQQWARCYRQNVGVNTNTKIERWRKEIAKRTAPVGTPAVKRMDHALHTLLDLIEQKLTGRAATATISHTLVPKPAPAPAPLLSDLQERHAASLEMSCATIIETGPGKTWIIPSSDSPNTLLETSEVTKLADTCELKCAVRCQFCNACAHQYTCSCPDNRIDMQMCKHIHKICQIYPQYSELVQIDVAEQGEFQELQIVNDQQQHMELVPQDASGAIHMELVQHVTFLSVDVRRANLITKLQMASAKVEFATTHEEIDILDQLLDAFIVNLDIWSNEQQKQPGEIQ